MTTVVQASKRNVQLLAPLGRVFHLLRRWPIIPGVILAIALSCAVFSPWLAPKDPLYGDLAARAAPPSWEHGWYAENPDVSRGFILGADQQGRDVLSRVIYGARISLLVSAVSLAAGITVGSILGMVSGYFGGIVDEVITRFVDLWYALPFLLIALAVVTVLGASLSVLLGLLALLAWSAGVRNVRAEVLSLRNREFIDQARLAGASPIRILWKHVLPNVMGTIMVIASLRVGQLILAEASLSFLGAGIPAPTPAWGSMVADGKDWLSDGWWISFFPGMAIFLVVMAFNFLGDWMRDRFDPRLGQL